MILKQEFFFIYVEDEQNNLSLVALKSFECLPQILFPSMPFINTPHTHTLVRQCISYFHLSLLSTVCQVSAKFSTLSFIHVTLKLPLSSDDLMHKCRIIPKILTDSSSSCDPLMTFLPSICRTSIEPLSIAKI